MLSVTASRRAGDRVLDDDSRDWLRCLADDGQDGRSQIERDRRLAQLHGMLVRRHGRSCGGAAIPRSGSGTRRRIGYLTGSGWTRRGTLSRLSLPRHWVPLPRGD
jgi:hypothetical protein